MEVIAAPKQVSDSFCVCYIPRSDHLCDRYDAEMSGCEIVINYFSLVLFAKLSILIIDGCLSTRNSSQSASFKTLETT